MFVDSPMSKPSVLAPRPLEVPSESLIVISIRFRLVLLSMLKTWTGLLRILMPVMVDEVILCA